MLSKTCSTFSSPQGLPSPSRRSPKSRDLGPLRSGKFDPSLLESSKQKGRRRKKVQKGGKFDGLDASKLFRGPRDTVLSDEVSS